MIYLKKDIKISDFQEGRRYYFFNENGELYLILLFISMKENTYQFKYELAKYDVSGTEIERIDLNEISSDISDFYLIQEKDPTETENLISVFAWKNQVIISTSNNRCYVYENGVLKFKYAYPGPFLDPVTSEDIKAQQVNFAAYFFPEKNGKLYLLTNGSPFGRTNSRHRFIAGISKDVFQGFGKEPFPSDYLADLWSDHKSEPINAQDYPFVPNMDLSAYGTVKMLNKIKRVYHPMIFQILDLNQKECIVSIFVDNKSKTASPDKNTPFLFLKVNKQTLEISGNISPQDGSVYKNASHYLIVDDLKNERLIFKTFEHLYIYDYDGKIIETINLSAEKLASFKKWVLIGRSELWTYFYNAETKDILGIDLGNNKSELISNVNAALKEYKIQTK